MRSPWFNSHGTQIAASLEDLHGPRNQISRSTALIETGAAVHFPHDMLTGSNKDGTLADGDATCRGWNGTVGFAVLGHSNKVGVGPDSNSWNSAHLSEGCTAEAFRNTGGRQWPVLLLRDQLRQQKAQISDTRATEAQIQTPGPQKAQIQTPGPQKAQTRTPGPQKAQKAQIKETHTPDPGRVSKIATSLAPHLRKTPQ